MRTEIVFKHVGTVEVLADISPYVVLNDKLATWMTEFEFREINH